MTKKQKIWTAVIIVLILLIVFRKNIANTLMPSDDSTERSKGLEPCYCRGVYKGMKRPNDCARMCEGLI